MKNDNNSTNNNTDKKGGSNRDWGYVSSDIEKTDEKGNQIIVYTSFEKDGKVNQYKDNGDGGHSHAKWNTKEDFEDGKDPDYNRTESNNSDNPSQEEIEENGGCYLTTACMNHYKHNFDDNCYELQLLRWYRDNFVSPQDIKEYYKSAPIIVNAIQYEKNAEIMFEKIYNNVVLYCVKAIENKQYDLAYKRYKDVISAFERKYCSRINSNTVETRH